ncbi:D-serine deaminase, pyridoxal phosphate-dependent [Maribacter sedimenticola]|uniref:D-serine deaminase, pyridoxal phosphate-dependent n=1 Tax=Maribacter sedimenticola TaxID=228956 RepID=A0ABY1SHU9_9FLAO|nr:D-TA family PLP-dependent enzyme [Maribacter sedimenticola]SNR55458.1 D-serine deaminase, pyridoxal phosphate-dependent [Maribacter sedimenticola]
MKDDHWYSLHYPEEVISPSLLVYPDRIQQNINTMISMVGDVNRLRPHVKTYKNANIIGMQMLSGIHKFKCATIPEAELLGDCNAKDVLLAMQPIGPNTKRFVELIKKYGTTKFSTLVDNAKTVNLLGDLAKANNIKISLWIDINNGMNRTGIAPDQKALALYRALNEHEHLIAEGLHVYDGHLRNTNPTIRQADCNTAFEPVLKLKAAIEQLRIPSPKIVAGGSPTFPFHCKRKDVEASPGTTLLWDSGYGTLFPEMNFLPAAVLITRILSKPTTGILCFDLGHKSIAPEMPFPRIEFLDLEHSKQISQSEEHLVVEYDDLTIPEIGDVHYAVPKHICPTVAKYDTLTVVKDNEVIDHWPVTARTQKSTI